MLIVSKYHGDVDTTIPYETRRFFTTPTMRENHFGAHDLWAETSDGTRVYVAFIPETVSDGAVLNDMLSAYARGDKVYDIADGIVKAAQQNATTIIE